MKKRKKRMILIVVLLMILIAAACYTVVIQPLLEKEEIVYEEGQVFNGNFKVEVVESGSLTYSIYDIAYDIDVNVATESEDEEEDEEEEELVQKYLEIEEVYTLAGMPINVGDPLLKFSESSITAVRNLLQSALVNAKADYNEAEIEYELAVLEAESTYEMQKINGKYADTVYQASYSQVQGDITSMELEKQKLIGKTADLQEAVTEAEEAYAEAKQEYDEVYASYMEYFSETDNIASFTIGQNNYRNAKSAYERAESTLEQARQNLDNNQEQIAQLEQNMVLAKASSTIDKLTVEQTYSENKMNAENADYTRSATLEGLAEDLQESLEEQKALEEKLADFEALVGTDGIVYAKEDGLITEAAFESGDTLETTGNLFSYAVENGMYITVDVTQEDIVTLAVGDAVSIDFGAYEDIYQGYIESINTTATAAESPTVSYQVTVHVIGTLDKLFGGMSANVSFVIEEREETLYVERKAIVEQNGHEYVYVKDGLTGKTLKEVETGLRNENFVEILSGITQEDIIYISVKK